MACQVCHKTCQPKVCTRCRNAWYCSVECQKVDWKLKHRKLCRVTVEDKDTVTAAWQELQSLAQNLSLNQAQEQYYKAQDEVEHQMAINATKTSKIQETPYNENTSIIQRDAPIGVNKKVASLHAKPMDREDHYWKEMGVVATNDTFSSILVEDMVQISRYQVTLKQYNDQAEPQRRINSVNDLEVSVIDSKDGSNAVITISLRSQDTSNRPLLTMELPCSLENNCPHIRTFVEKDGTIQIRLPYHKYAHEGSDSGTLLYDSRHQPATISTKIMNNLQCRLCGLTLIAESSVERALLLPAGYWDEIADYLICYNGQPTVEFGVSSTSAQPRLALYDSNVICLHQQDVGTSVCALAVNGYGEEDKGILGSEGDSSSANRDKVNSIEHKDASATVRGTRQWFELVGGASICCSQCCAPLGFASLESPGTYRFLRHRLSTFCSGSAGDSPIQHDVLTIPMSSCASFLARELVRYAESKAIFTFVVSVDMPEGTTLINKCILLRLLAWDAVMATRFESSACQRLKFESAAKIVYEVTTDRYANANGNHNSSDDGDIVNWVWGGVDLCCLPEKQPSPSDNDPRNSDNQASNQSQSAVRLQLPYEEWEEVLRVLTQNSKWFSKSVSDTTILVTMAKKADSSASSEVGLSAIPLSPLS